MAGVLAVSTIKPTFSSAAGGGPNVSYTRFSRPRCGDRTGSPREGAVPARRDGLKSAHQRIHQLELLQAEQSVEPASACSFPLPVSAEQHGPYA